MLIVFVTASQGIVHYIVNTSFLIKAQFVPHSDNIFMQSEIQIAWKSLRHNIRIALILFKLCFMNKILIFIVKQATGIFVVIEIFTLLKIYGRAICSNHWLYMQTAVTNGFIWDYFCLFYYHFYINYSFWINQRWLKGSVTCYLTQFLSQVFFPLKINCIFFNSNLQVTSHNNEIYLNGSWSFIETSTKFIVWSFFLLGTI